jgi:hypothetical protein
MSHMLMRMDSVKNLEVVEDESFPLEGRKKVQRKSVSEAATNLEALQEEEEAKQKEEDEGLDLSWPEGLQNQVPMTRSTMLAVGLNTGQHLRRWPKQKRASSCCVNLCCRSLLIRCARSIEAAVLSVNGRV